VRAPSAAPGRYDHHASAAAASSETIQTSMGET
jgi:hypothetical protein